MFNITTTDLYIAQPTTSPFRSGWDSKMYLDLFKEELASGLCCDVLLAGNQNFHLRKAINNHKNIVISSFGGREAWHVVH
jgi:hypothetical protein